MVSPFAYKDFSDFNRNPNPQNLYVATMTRYKEDFGLDVAYPPSDIKNSLGEMISKNGLKQWRIAEKEKEAHVTNFFNGGKLDSWEGEERLIVSSRKMKGDEYLEHPEMSAEKVVSEVLARKDGDASLFVINFANPDMIAHTGDFNATVKAIQITDMSLKTLVPEIIKNPEYAVIITADHGNAEELVDPETGEKDTQHSTRNIPMIFVGSGLELLDSTGKTLEMLANDAPFGSVVDVAPSVLELLGIEKPKEMVGNCLISC
jgi:2,3-bisphosphoglycerate-independent phosphoglycerate mutase